jgi:hypothetical protein
MNGPRMLVLAAIPSLFLGLPEAATGIDPQAEQEAGPRALTRFAVRASEACEPRRPECSIAAALEMLADGGTLELSPGRHAANLRLTRDVTIEGAGMGVTTLDGGHAGRVLKVEAGARVTVRGVTVTGGSLEKELERDGGGIWNLGTLTLERSEVTDNVAVDDGGGIRNDGTLTVVESTVHDNRAARWGSVGGGIYNPVIVSTPKLEVIASTIHGNVAGDHGGGIWCEGTVTLVNSTVSGNSAAHTGGGIRNNGELTVSNSTIAFNRAGTTGGGIHHLGISITLANTILAANSAGTGGADCDGPFTSGGHNLVQESAGCKVEGGKGDLLGADPKLAPLAIHGGHTPTHGFAGASPAVDAGSAEPPASGGACAPSDQRGLPRPADGDADGRAVCDIGAFEAAAGPTRR